MGSTAAGARRAVPGQLAARSVRVWRARRPRLRRRASRRVDGLPLRGAGRNHRRGAHGGAHRSRSRRAGTRARRAVRARAELPRGSRPDPRGGSALPAGRDAGGGRSLHLLRGQAGIRLRRRPDLGAGRRPATRGHVARPAERHHPARDAGRLGRLPGPARGDALVPDDVRAERPGEHPRRCARPRHPARPVLVAAHPDRDRGQVRADPRDPVGADRAPSRRRPWWRSCGGSRTRPAWRSSRRPAGRRRRRPARCRP